jgi:hypothetical protein
MRTNLIKIRLSGATGPTKTALLSEKPVQNRGNWQKWMSRWLWMDSMLTHFISSSWNKPHLFISMKWWVLSYVFDVKWHFIFDDCYKKQFVIFEYSWSTPKFQILLGNFRTPFLIDINTLVTMLKNTLHMRDCSYAISVPYSIKFWYFQYKFIILGSLLDVSASFGMDGVEFVNVGELCWSTSLCGGPYKLIKAGPCFLQRKVWY